MKYPAARRSDQQDVYHGTPVGDPYRWLEELDTPETQAWVNEQRTLTEGYFSQIPERSLLKERLTKLWNFERYGNPVKRGGKYFFEYNEGTQDQNQLLYTTALDGMPQLLIDPNQLSKDGTVSLAGWVPSPDGMRVAYGLAAAGSDWREWRVRDVATGEDLPDLIRWVKFSEPVWDHAGTGLYYSRYDEPKPGEELTAALFFQKLFYHRLGETQAQDTLIHADDGHPKWGFGGEVSDDGHWLVVTVWESSNPKNQVLLRDLTQPNAPLKELITGFDAEYVFLGNQGNQLWFRTDHEADRGQVIVVDAMHPERTAWKTLVPQADETLEGASVVGGRLILSYLKDAHSAVKVYSQNGTLEGELTLPGLGTVTGFTGKPSDQETFYSFTSFTRPATVYHYDIATGKSSIFKAPRVDFNPDDFEVKQEFYASRDGTRIPLFLVSKRNLPNLPEGPRPCLLYGYGGFNISITPSFSVGNLVWLEQGGVYAVPNLRGGGEYGRVWHEAGMQSRKQNVFDDFISAAEYLIDKQITTPDKLAIHGRSNGGLLVGACMTQRPDLFAAAIPGVGVMDMLRFHKFTIGWAWVEEFGSADSAEQFSVLHKYSPLHNLKPGTPYPATLIVTADHDDRVVPGHSYKFAAELQHAQAGVRPTLIRIETSAGHGAGTPVSKRIEQAADELAFLIRELEVKRPDH